MGARDALANQRFRTSSEGERELVFGGLIRHSLRIPRHETEDQLISRLIWMYIGMALVLTSFFVLMVCFPRYAALLALLFVPYMLLVRWALGYHLVRSRLSVPISTGRSLTIEEYLVEIAQLYGNVETASRGLVSILAAGAGIWLLTMLNRTQEPENLLAIVVLRADGAEPILLVTSILMGLAAILWWSLSLVKLRTIRQESPDYDAEI
ncbi:MAG: hypothetical protein R6W82_01825 [bacterium]